MQTLPAGVRRTPLEMHRDSRGCLTEIYRDQWPTGTRPVQWNVVCSNPGTLRGVHVHLRHSDYLVLISGKMRLGLKDLRVLAPTFGMSAMVTLSEDRPEGWTIPPGVAHGFYLPVESVFCYSVSDYWNPDDELGCRWNDPALGLEWPDSEPLLSDRDRTAPPLETLLDSVRDHPFSKVW